LFHDFWYAAALLGSVAAKPLQTETQFANTAWQLAVEHANLFL
jgi:hypothetical protein